MSNTIKNYIKEIEQKRQKMIIENSIIKKRFALVESFDSLFSEIKYLNKQSFDCNNINENLLQVLNSMFQDDGKSFMDTVKSKLSDFLVTKLGYEGFEKEVIMKAIGDTEYDDDTFCECIKCPDCSEPTEDGVCDQCETKLIKCKGMDNKGCIWSNNDATEENPVCYSCKTTYDRQEEQKAKEAAQ